MELHRQQCQSCNSIRVRNILVRETGRPTVVYVRCDSCEELVAVYELSRYYHHGKGLDSYLRSRGAGNAESGRRMLEEFEDVRIQAIEGFAAVLAEMKRLGKI